MHTCIWCLQELQTKESEIKDGDGKLRTMASILMDFGRRFELLFKRTQIWIPKASTGTDALSGDRKPPGTRRQTSQVTC